MTTDEEILSWMDALIDYAKDWDSTFPKKEYFTQEFWYLLVECYRAEKLGTPLTISDVQGKMKAGSPNVRRTRIQNAIDDGFLKEERHPGDGRATLIVPTATLKEKLTEHFVRTRNKAVIALSTRGDTP